MNNLAKAFQRLGYKIEEEYYGRHQQWLRDTYPVAMSNCYCGADYPTAWNDAVHEALGVIEASQSYTVAQIKDKFGGLRLYYDSFNHDGIIYDSVNDMESLWKYVAVEMAIKRAERKVYEIEKARGNKWLQESNDERY